MKYDGGGSGCSEHTLGRCLGKGGLTNCRTHRHNVPVTKALNRDILAAEKERKKRRKEEEEEVI